MASGHGFPVNNLSEFMDQLNTDTPAMARRGLNEIGRLDQEVNRRSVIYNQRKIDYLATFTMMTPEQRLLAFYEIEGMMAEMTAISRKKVQIAEYLRDHTQEAIDLFKEHEKVLIENVPADFQERVDAKENQAEEAPKRMGCRKKKKRPAKKEEAVKDTKTYCWCQLEKEDRMICCDNKDCKFEWFHFTCISLTKAPPGKWYCSEACEAADKNRPPDAKKDAEVGAEESSEADAAPSTSDAPCTSAGPSTSDAPCTSAGPAAPVTPGGKGKKATKRRS